MQEKNPVGMCVTIDCPFGPYCEFLVDTCWSNLEPTIEKTEETKTGISSFCSKEMIFHLQKHSTYLNIYDEVSFLEFIGLPEGMDRDDFEKCADDAKEAKTSWQMENPDYQSYEENLRTTLGSCYLSKHGLPHFAFGISYHNNTHYIDNRYCEWINISDPNLQKILDDCKTLSEGLDIFRSHSHADYYIDNIDCQWMIQSEKPPQAGH